MTRYLHSLLTLLAWTSMGWSQPCTPAVNLGDTVSFCQGNSLTLNATAPSATSYIWSNASTNPTITVQTGGTYWVQASNSCGSTRDTVVVVVDQPLQPNLGPDRPLCGSTALTLDPNLPSYYNYTWSTGASSPSISITSTGTYWLSVGNACGTFSDTVQINSSLPPAGFSLGPDIFKCSSGAASLAVPPFMTGNIQWSNGSSNRSTLANQTGTYWVSVTNPCGTFRDSIYVQLQDDLDFNFPDTIPYCPGDQVPLDIKLQGSASWSHGVNSNSVVLSSPGWYTVQFSHPCGTLEDSVFLNDYSGYTLDLGPDTSFCHQATVEADSGALAYRWSNGQSSRSLGTFAGGTYSVQAFTPCDTLHDTISFNIRTSPQKILPDTAGICPPEPISLDAGFWGPSSTYLWDNNQQTQIRSVSQPGTYWVQVMNSCDTIQDSVVVIQDEPLNDPQVRDSLNLPPSRLTVCDTGFGYLFDVNLPGSTTLSWDSLPPGTTTFPVADTAIYTLANTCDTLSDTLFLNLIAYLNDLVGNPQSPQYFCQGDTLFLGPDYGNGVHYQWARGDTTRLLPVTETGVYPVTMTTICDTLDTAYVAYADSAIVLPPLPDTTICRPHFLTIPLDTSGSLSYTLNGRSVQAPLKLRSSGLYKLTATNSCGAVTDSFQLQMTNRPVSTVSPNSFCQGDSVKLNALQNQAQDYLWSTGDTTADIYVDQPGWYYVDISNECATIRDSTYIRRETPIPPIDLGNDTIFCEGSLTLDAGSHPGAQYYWQNGSRTQFFTVTHSGTYYVEVSNKCNKIRDSIEVLITGPPTAVLGTEVSYCEQNSFSINAQNPGSSYRWNTGDTTASITVPGPGIYWVEITNDCGQLTDTVQVFTDGPMPADGLGPNQIACQGDTVWLNPQMPRADLFWNNGRRDDSLPVTQTGTYHLRAENLCGTFFDSVRITIEDTPVFDIGDTAVCYRQDSILLRGPAGMRHYQWSNGKTSSSIWVYEEQELQLEVANSCFRYTDTIQVRNDYPLELDLSSDTALCQNNTLEVDLRHYDLPVEWSDGSRAARRTISRSGRFAVTIQNRCGRYHDTLRAYFHKPIADSSFAYRFCKGDSLSLGPGLYGYDGSWEHGEESAQTTVRAPGRYTASISNRCNQALWTYDLTQQLCDCPLFFPNAFTPTGDKLNETFQPSTACILEEFEMIIFNRWGQELYRTSDIDKGWNGQVKGDLAPSDIYLYRATYRWKGKEAMSENIKRGSFSLLR